MQERGLKILFLTRCLDRGGAEKQLALLATGLPREHFDVHVGVLTRTGPLESVLEKAGIPVTVFDKSWKVDPGAYWRLRRHIRAVKPDVVHVMMDGKIVRTGGIELAEALEESGYEWIEQELFQDTDAAAAPSPADDSQA